MLKKTRSPPKQQTYYILHNIILYIIYYNIAFLSNFILNEPVCFAKTFCFIKLNKHSFWTNTFQKTYRSVGNK